MGNRDRQKGDVKKPKKVTPRQSKPLASTALVQPLQVPDLVRKKKRSEPEPEEE
ncbi:MAG: hypothetical protein M1401_13275 [Chloroflexi bacterium]|nr:hypothetical protein [Chloroflexota bacterium]